MSLTTSQIYDLAYSVIYLPVLNSSYSMHTGTYSKESCFDGKILEITTNLPFVYFSEKSLEFR
jgi:hypothetical protein